MNDTSCFGTTNSGNGEGVSPDELERQLERILQSRTFAKSPRLQALLRYTVDQIQAGRGDDIKEYLLGIEVFGRKPSFDPRIDSIVRVQASRLREKLEKYYASEGRADTVLIALPKGAYIPTAERRRQAAPRRRRYLALGVAAAVLLGGAALWRSRSNGRIGEPQPSVLRRLTSDAGFTGYPAVSRDGKWIAFASDRNGPGSLAVWVSPAGDGSAARRLTDHEANDYEPAFSPDNRHIVFRSDRGGGGIYIVPVAGGEAKLIARYGRRPRFSPDGSQILYWQRDENWGPGRIYTVPSTGGEPTQLVPNFADAHYPVWSPDGAELLFCGTRNPEDRTAGHDWWVLRLASGEVRKTAAADALSRAVPPGARRLAGLSADILGVPGGWAEGRILFSTRLGDGEDVWELAMPMDRQVTGAPHRLTFGAGMEGQPYVRGSHVAFVSGSLSINVWMTPIDASRGTPAGDARRITDDYGPFALSPSASPDGRKLAFISTRAGSRDVWFKNLETGQATALTATPVAEEGSPCLTADGARVAYRVIEEPKQAIYVVESGRGIPRKICGNCGLPTDWSHDGRTLLFEPGSRIPGIGLLDTASGAAKEIAVHATYKLHGARFSPDDAWIAFQAETGPHTRRIFVARLQRDGAGGESEWIPITAGKDVDAVPAWSADGNLIYFVSERDGFRCIWAQRLDPETKRGEGEPFAVQHFHTGSRGLLTTFRANPSQIGLSVTAAGLVYSLEELRGNIWTMELR